jgi:uncharacterized protein YqiB (DUF1249 family)
MVLSTQLNYQKFMKVLPNSDNTYFKFKSGGLMDLVIEKLYDVEFKSQKGIVYSMAHYGEMNGDLMKDPDMTFVVLHQSQSIEALSFQNDYVGYYQEVYNSDFTACLKTARKELNEFLSMWLDNVLSSRYKLYKSN